MDDFKRSGMRSVGHSGWSCPCCGPKPGKDKDKHRRSARRRLALSLPQETQEAMDEARHGNLKQFDTIADLLDDLNGIEE